MVKIIQVNRLDREMLAITAFNSDDLPPIDGHPSVSDGRIPASRMRLAPPPGRVEELAERRAAGLPLFEDHVERAA